VTLRSGGNPRDQRGRGERGPTPAMPTWRASDGRGGPPSVRRRRGDDERRGFRIPGALKFLLFAGILAAIVLTAFLTAFRPVVRAGVVGWAWDNPAWILRVDFVNQLVLEDLGSGYADAPASSDPSEGVFEVRPNESIFEMAPRLQEAGFLTNPHAFLYLAMTSELQPKLQAGSFVLRHDMSPADLVKALVQARIVFTSVNVTFREGIRLEQMTALLETIESKVDPQAFYDLVKHPPEDLLADYPWLTLPKGASLEGFLYPATYTLVTSVTTGPFQVTDATGLVHMLLDKFHEAVGEARMNVPATRGLSFYQIVTLASIVEHETPLDSERPTIAGVYQNRLDGLNGIAPLLNADPTVIWAVDTVKLSKTPLATWKDYFFWDVPKTKMADIALPASLQGYQTYQVVGLIPGPIATPTATSIDAALNPDTATGYLYFVAIPGTQQHAFAKTLAEHNANLKKYGYT
jgi:UPF0755 protein